MFPPGIANLYAAIVSGVLLYALPVLAERRSGQVIMLVVSLIAVAMPDSTPARAAACKAASCFHVPDKFLVQSA